MTQDFDSQSGLIQSDNSSPSEAVDSLNTTASNPKMPTDIVSQPSVSHLKLVVSKKPGKKASKLFASSLKLVASSGISAPVYKSAPVKSSTFTAEVRKRSPYDFTMIAHDPFHYLRCELPLKFEETEEALSLICQFPTIGDDQLVDFIDDDESLLGIVLVSFHMHILQNLFLFSAAHQVKNIIVKTTKEQFKGLGIHEELIRHVDKIPTKKGIAPHLRGASPRPTT